MKPLCAGHQAKPLGVYREATVPCLRAIPLPVAPVQSFGAHVLQAFSFLFMYGVALASPEMQAAVCVPRILVVNASVLPHLARSKLSSVT